MSNGDKQYTNSVIATGRLSILEFYAMNAGSQCDLDNVSVMVTLAAGWE
jgi:hypothetical protein